MDDAVYTAAATVQKAGGVVVIIFDRLEQFGEKDAQLAKSCGCNLDTLLIVGQVRSVSQAAKIFGLLLDCSAIFLLN